MSKITKIRPKMRTTTILITKDQNAWIEANNINASRLFRHFLDFVMKYQSSFKKLLYQFKKELGDEEENVY